MDAWVYLFSKFTHEALLFEALAICLGIFGYAIFYLIRKRKYGVAGKDVPSNIVRVYLGQLMADAEEIRTQLFGLLGKGEASARFMAGLQFQTDASFSPTADASGAASSGPATSASPLAHDPKLQENLKELERKLAEQANALDSVLNDKMKLEEELATARARSDSPASDNPDEAGAGEPDRSAPLQERVKQLEAQLAEYAIIEDDLANLKRLQKENKTLKEQLASAAEGGILPNPTASPAAETAASGPTLETRTATTAEPTEPEAPALPKETPKPIPQEIPLEATASESSVTDDIIATETVENLHANDPDHPADFESLVDVVEKNLAETTKSDTVEASAPNPEADAQPLPAGPTAELITDEKSEEQLQADFEKMLKS